MISTTPRKDWPAYNLSTENVVFDGQSTKYQVIVRNGKFVNFLTKQYKVLPNEDVLKIASEAANSIGARPATNLTQTNKWFKSKENVIYSPDGNKMTAFFELDKPFDVTGKGDYVQKGFGVMNSIDGYTGFKVFPTDIRGVCNNIMMHLYSQLTLADGDVEHIVLDVKDPVYQAGLENLKDAQADWNKLNPKPWSKLDTVKNAFFSMRHSKSIDLEIVKKAIDEIAAKADAVMARYHEMYQLKLSISQAKKLLETLPKVITNHLDYIKVQKDEITLAKPVSEWDAFNDVTQLLTYGGLTYRSTMSHFRNVDAILVAQHG